MIAIEMRFVDIANGVISPFCHRRNRQFHRPTVRKSRTNQFIYGELKLSLPGPRINEVGMYKMLSRCIFQL
ncbi:UNVERIFIED_ORG: hypothetical protein J2Y77_002212 [Pseudomonas lini]